MGAGRISRMKSPCAGFQPAESDRDLAGDMLYNFAAQASEVCCDACAQNQDCQGFAFAGERCYLKTNVTGTFANESIGRFHGVGLSAGLGIGSWCMFTALGSSHWLLTSGSSVDLSNHSIAGCSPQEVVALAHL